MAVLNSFQVIVIAAFVVTVQSFSHSHFGGDAISLRHHIPTVLYNDHNKHDQLIYGMGGENLCKRWSELVSEGEVTATTMLHDDSGDDGKGLRVKYGVRLEKENNSAQRLLEFVEILSDEQDFKTKDHITSINTTLTEMQQLASNDRLAIQCIYDGPYAAQLQLIRTLRPPRSKDMSSSTNKDEKVSCQPPPYDSSKDSFLVGPLRLFGHGEFHGDGEPRARAARLWIPSDDANRIAAWDAYHNISPVDPRGHYLLLPKIDDKREWRDQSLSLSDCYDVTYLAYSIVPAGSMILSFNSVGAGASQNHIHCHAWICPPPPFLGRTGTAENMSGYAVTKASATSSLTLAHGVHVSLLDYPCTCIKLSASVATDKRQTPTSPILKEMGNALSSVVKVAQDMQVPHNVAWTNSQLKSRSDDNDESQSKKNLINLELYVFFRRAETSSLMDGDIFRLGASEMLGVFHSSSNAQLQFLSNNKMMNNILADVSLPREFVWAEVCKTLEK